MSKEIIWLTKYDEKLDNLVSHMVEEMKKNNIKNITFFVDDDTNGYSIQACGNFESFEVRNSVGLY